MGEIKIITSAEEQLRVFYWNTKGKDLSTALLELLKSRNYDVLIFGETTKNSRHILKESLALIGYIPRTKIVNRIRVVIFDKYEEPEIKYLKEDQKQTTIIYNINNENYMIVGVHFYSAVSYPNVEDRNDKARDEYKLIDKNRKKYNVENVLIIGDFNLNPYDRGIVGELAFKATHCKNTAENTGSPKEYLYNASWKIFSNDLSEDTLKAPGTIHYIPKDKGYNVNFWHVFDQALFSKAMISKYNNSIEVLTEWNNIRLLDNDLIPNKSLYSDHLPISIEFNLGSGRK